MTRFEKFYEWLRNATCPLMIIGLAIAACVIVKVVSGLAGTDADAIVLISSLVWCYLVFIVRVVCHIIEAMMIKSRKGTHT